MRRRIICASSRTILIDLPSSEPRRCLIVATLDLAPSPSGSCPSVPFVALTTALFCLPTLRPTLSTSSSSTSSPSASPSTSMCIAVPVVVAPAAVVLAPSSLGRSRLRPSSSPAVVRLIDLLACVGLVQADPPLFTLLTLTLVTIPVQAGLDRLHAVPVHYPHPLRRRRPRRLHHRTSSTLSIREQQPRCPPCRVRRIRPHLSSAPPRLRRPRLEPRRVVLVPSQPASSCCPIASPFSSDLRRLRLSLVIVSVMSELRSSRGRAHRLWPEHLARCWCPPRSWSSLVARLSPED